MGFGRTKSRRKPVPMFAGRGNARSSACPRPGIGEPSAVRTQVQRNSVDARYPRLAGFVSVELAWSFDAMDRPGVMMADSRRGGGSANTPRMIVVANAVAKIPRQAFRNRGLFMSNRTFIIPRRRAVGRRCSGLCERVNSADGDA